MFVQIHFLRDYSTALPNRGQDGLAKRTTYGGVERQRISSQSFKAALRDAETLVRQGNGSVVVPDTMADVAKELSLTMSVRSALIGERKLKPALEKAEFGDDASAWSNAIMGLWRAEDAEVASDTPIVIGEKEIEALVDMAVALRSARLEAKAFRPLFEKARPDKGTPEAALSALKSLRALRSHAGIDGALFGRFATGVAVNNVDAAVHVAHLVTVHPLFSVTDFFSVQDLLKTGEGEDRGGSHINTAELTSGLFYGYVVIDVRQLSENFSELTPEQRSGLIAWIVRAVAQVEPAAKLGSTAPYSGLREVMVEVGRRQPRTLIGAFEVPVETTAGRSLSEEARSRLRDHADETDKLVGAPGWRSYLRDHTEQSLPAIEALAAATGAETSRQVAGA
jgi:CRISPR system Cascade subunit CasC